MTVNGAESSAPLVCMALTMRSQTAKQSFTVAVAAALSS